MKPHAKKSIAFIGLVALTGCANHHHGRASKVLSNGARVAGMPSPAANEMFDAIKDLEGTWYMKDDAGHEQVASVFHVTAGGTSVREIMFPGEPHEMTNLYHLDGDKVVMTHYCAAGNQPTMAAAFSARDGSIPFEFQSVSNLASPETMFMGAMTLRFPETNTLVQDWASFVGSARQAGEHSPSFTLIRK